LIKFKAWRILLPRQAFLILSPLKILARLTLPSQNALPRNKKSQRIAALACPA
jgi:hypothetical protein